MTVNNGLIAEGLATNAGNIVFTSIYDDFHGGDSNSDGTATAAGNYPWSGILINDVALDALTRFANCIFRYAQSGNGAIRTISSSPSIQYCSFNNDNVGVYAAAASNPVINYCDFYNISGLAVNNVNQSFVINAENCWWGSNTGPTHSGNPSGTGEPVTNSVDYLPFGTIGVINPLMGDVSLNGIIQAYDASLVLQHTVAIITLNSKQLVVADVSGAAGVTALDASLILQFVVGMINSFPAELLKSSAIYASQAELAIGSQTVLPGEEFELPLSLKNVDSVLASQLTLHFDPEYLDVLQVESLIPGMNLTYNTESEPGVILISFAGTEALLSDLTFAKIHFKAKEDAPYVKIPVEAVFFMANESVLTSSVTNGNIIINGMPTEVESNLATNANLLTCYPNPASDQVRINYTVKQEGVNVLIAIYDILGQQVAEIVNGRHAAESYSIMWNCNYHNGIRLPAGAYFIRMVAGNKTDVVKFQIVR